MAKPGAGGVRRGDYARRDYLAKAGAVLGVCRRIEAGVTLAEACRCPTAPQWSTMASWLTRYPEFAAMVEAARAVAAEAFGPRRAYHRWNPKVAAEVLRRLEDGRGLDEVCAAPDMPAYSTVRRWINERPDYAQAYLRARDAQADRLFDLAWRIALEADEAGVQTARLKIQTLKWRCAKLAPRRYGAFKAQEPEDTAPEGGAREGRVGPAGKAREVMLVEARRFAGTPDGQVVETTRAVRGMSTDEVTAFRRAIGEGRITLEELAVLNSRGEP